MIELCYHTVEELKAAYLSFVQQGVLFIPMVDVFSMGEELELKLLLPDRSVAIVSGRVVWRVPIATEVFDETGVGVQLIHAAGLEMADKIKQLLLLEY